MLKTCSRSGIVPVDHVCPYSIQRKYKLEKRNREEKNSPQDKFRKSYRWTKKAKEIKERDHFLCQVCIRNKYNTINVYNYNKLEVHHIVFLSEDFNKRLDDGNLITLCDYHHKMADDGEIPKEELLSYISPLYKPTKK